MVHFVIQGERRKSRRFSLRLHVVVRWTDGSFCGESETETQDVSAHGLRFLLRKGLGNGSLIEVLMTLPHQVTGAGPVLVECQACVVRSNLKDWEEVEVMAEIQRFQFVRDTESAK